MKRAAFLYSLIFICLAADRAAFGQSDARPGAEKACPFSIVGLWRSDVTTDTNPIFFSFSPEGLVTLLGFSADTLPQDFEMIAAVGYKLDNPAAPKRIQFTARRGNEAFPPGVTSMEITDYSNDSFTTLNPAIGQKMQWVREQMRLYFLTLAARSGPPPHGGPAFAMWTVLDGRNTKIETLGIQLGKDDAGKTLPVFEPIPAELYERFKEEVGNEKKSKPDENVIVRFELTQAEYETTHKVYEVWEKYVKTRALPYADPYLNGMEFLSRAAEGLNQCGEKAKLYKLTRRERDEIVSKHNSPQHLLEYIRVMRKKNDELHVTDAKFPWAWRPLIQLPGQ